MKRPWLWLKGKGLLTDLKAICWVSTKNTSLIDSLSYISLPLFLMQKDSHVTPIGERRALPFISSFWLFVSCECVWVSVGRERIVCRPKVPKMPTALDMSQSIAKNRKLTGKCNANPISYQPIFITQWVNCYRTALTCQFIHGLHEIHLIPT